MFSQYYGHIYLNGKQSFYFWLFINGADASLNRGGTQVQVKEEAIQKSGAGDTNVAGMCLS